MLGGCASGPGSSPAPAPPSAAVTNAPAAPAVETAKPSLPWSTEWTELFNGRDLSNWAVTDFVAHGPVKVESEQIKLGAGAIMTGINWTNGALPKTDYEISLEALKSDGVDFFCGLTFPVGDSYCSLILGGWGGAVAGLSSLDDLDASENETSKHMFFEVGRWYAVRMRVTTAKIEAWVDHEKIVDVGIAGRKVSLRPGPIEFCKPLGLATYQTGAAARDFKLRLTKP
jgi:hypothetical protein